MSHCSFILQSKTVLLVNLKHTQKCRGQNISTVLRSLMSGSSDTVGFSKTPKRLTFVLWFHVFPFASRCRPREDYLSSTRQTTVFSSTFLENRPRTLDQESKCLPNYSSWTCPVALERRQTSQTYLTSAPQVYCKCVTVVLPVPLGVKPQTYTLSFTSAALILPHLHL